MYDDLKEAMENFVGTSVVGLSDLVTNKSGLIVDLSWGILVFSVIVVCALGYSRYIKFRGAKMIEGQDDPRQARIRVMFCESINNAILDLWFNEQITKKEMRKLFKETSIKLDMPDLVPKADRQSIVKKEVKSRLYNGTYGNPEGTLPKPLKAKAKKEVVKEGITKFLPVGMSNSK